MVRVLRRIGDRQLDGLDLAVEAVVARLVLRRHRSAAVFAHVAAIVGREDHRQRGANLPLADLLAVNKQRRLAALAQAAAGIGELHAHLALARRNGLLGPDDEVLHAAPVIAVPELAVLGIETPAADVRALRDDHALGALLRYHDVGGDGVRFVLDVEHAVLGQTAHAADEHLRITFDQHRPSGGVGVDLLQHPVVDGQHLVARRLDQPEPLQLHQLLRVLLGQVPGLAPVLGRVVELPDVVVERGPRGHDPGRVVLRHGRPPLVVEGTVAHDLEVLRLVPLRRLAVVEGVKHARAFDRVLLDAFDGDGLGQPRRLEDCRRHVDDVAELVTDLALGFDALRPVDDRAVAGAAEVRGDLLGPLVRRVQGMRPAHGEVVVGVGAAQLIDLTHQVFGRLEGLQTVEVGHLVEAPVDVALGGRAVVADDVVDQRVFEDVQLLQEVKDAAHMVVGVLQEPGIDLHLAAQHRLERLRHVVPGRNILGACGKLAILRDHAQLLLAGQRLLAQLVPSLVELALVLVGPFLRDMVRGVGRARREIDEERLVGGKRLLLANPPDGLVGHVIHQVVPLLGGLVRLDRRGPLVEGRVPLVRLAAEEPVEVLEAATARGPGVEWPDGAGLPDRHLVALAELGRVVAVELEGLRQGRHGVGPYRAVARRPGGDLRDAGHACGVVVAAGQQRLPRRRADGRSMETGVLQAFRRQILRVRRRARAAEGARSAKPAVVNQDNQDVGRALRRAQIRDRRCLPVRVLRVVRDELRLFGVRHRQMRTVLFVFVIHGFFLLLGFMILFCWQCLTHCEVLYKNMPEYPSALLGG